MSQETTVANLSGVESKKRAFKTYLGNVESKKVELEAPKVNMLLLAIYLDAGFKFSQIDLTKLLDEAIAIATKMGSSNGQLDYLNSIKPAWEEKQPKNSSAGQNKA